MGAIFICYRRSDSEDVTGRLNEKLVERFGQKRVFHDVRNIAPGLDYDVVIRQALDKTVVLLVVIGDRWDLERLAEPDDPVRCEIEQAMARSIRIIPLLVRGAKMPPQAALPAPIVGFERRNALPLRGDPDFQNDIARLIAAVESRVSRWPAWMQRVRRAASEVRRRPLAPARMPRVPRWLPALMPRRAAGRIAVVCLAILVAIAATQVIIDRVNSNRSSRPNRPDVDQPRPDEPTAVPPAEGSQAETP